MGAMIAEMNHSASVDTQVPSALYVLGWCEHSPTPAAVVDRDCQLIWTNQAGDRLLSEGSHIRAFQGRVGCADGLQDPEFRTFVRNLTEPGVWACRGDDDHMLVRGDLTSPPGLPEAVGLSFFPAHPRAEYIWADFRKLFGLTVAEAALVRRLVDGDRVETLAETLGLSVETVRTHIRRSYAKLGVGSREELFSVVSPFRIR